MSFKNETVERIRQFNRFYTPIIGILNDKYIESCFSVSEARILFELKNNTGCGQKYLVETLNIDKSYLSRIIKKFEKLSLINKEISSKDARTVVLSLTKKGLDVADTLIETTNMQINSLISSLNKKECENLCIALNTVEKCLRKGNIK